MHNKCMLQGSYICFNVFRESPPTLDLFIGISIFIIFNIFITRINLIRKYVKIWGENGYIDLILSSNMYASTKII